MLYMVLSLCKSYKWHGTDPEYDNQTRKMRTRKLQLMTFCLLLLPMKPSSTPCKWYSSLISLSYTWIHTHTKGKKMLQYFWSRRYSQFRFEFWASDLIVKYICISISYAFFALLPSLDNTVSRLLQLLFGVDLEYLKLFFLSNSSLVPIWACIIMLIIMLIIWLHLSSFFVKEPLCRLHSGEPEAVAVCTSIHLGVWFSYL